MAIDWSGYQIPSYLAAQQYRDTGHDVGSALGGLFLKGTTRQDISTKNMGEAIRGQGRSYYKDNVDHALYDDYEDWLKKEGGRYLLAAEGGAEFQNVGGEYQMKTPGGEWATMGTEGEDGKWNPYGDSADLNQFEKSLQQKFLGDWMGGEYSYRTPKSALGALFSKERYKPVSNIYQQLAKDQLAQRHAANPGTYDWSQLSNEPASLGWYPGKYLTGKGILGKYIMNIGKNKSSGGTPSGTPSGTPAGTGSGTKPNVNINQNANQNVNPSQTVAPWSYTKGGVTQTLPTQISTQLANSGMTSEQFTEDYEKYLQSAGSFPMNQLQYATYLVKNL